MALTHAVIKKHPKALQSCVKTKPKQWWRVQIGKKFKGLLITRTSSTRNDVRHWPFPRSLRSLPHLHLQNHMCKQLIPINERAWEFRPSVADEPVDEFREIIWLKVIKTESALEDYRSSFQRSLEFIKTSFWKITDPYARIEFRETYLKLVTKNWMDDSETRGSCPIIHDAQKPARTRKPN